MNATETLKKMREQMMMQRYRRRSIDAYTHYAAQFIDHLRICDATSTREDRVISYLTKLAVEDQVSASTQKVALCAIKYLYESVLRFDLGDISKVTRSRRVKRLPEVFSRKEAWAALDSLDGDGWIWGALMYGCGLRLMEVYQLRVKDIDLDCQQIAIKDGKGGKDRILPLPEMLSTPLEKHLRNLRRVYEDFSGRSVKVSLPHALARKYPSAPGEWRWFWLFPASGPARDPKWGGLLHHVHPTAIQKRIVRAIKGAGITKKAGCHTFRHSFATHWLENAEGSHEVALLRLQKLLGHADPSTTMLYLHLIKQSTDVPSPLDVRPVAA